MEANIVNRVIRVHAPVGAVWKVLIDAELGRQWMSDEPLEIVCTWAVGEPVLVRGKLHGMPFENKGIVLQCEPHRVLQYTYLSSLSRLPDRPQNYSIIEFTLAPDGDHTALTLTQRNFITLTNYKHFDLYWGTTLGMIKRLAEQS